MTELKTKPNSKSVEDFLDSVENDKRRRDSFETLELIKSIIDEEPQMWGDSIVGFGSYHYKYDSGREGYWFLTGFSPRKQYLTFYIMPGYKDYSDILDRLGKYKTGKSCLYIKKLEDIDKEVLKELIKKSVEDMKQNK